MHAIVCNRAITWVNCDLVAWTMYFFKKPYIALNYALLLHNQQGNI